MTRSAQEMWRLRAVATLGIGPADDVPGIRWFQECFGREPEPGELEELTDETLPLHSPTGAMLGSLLGVTCIVPGVDGGDSQVLAYPEDFSLATLLPALAEYLYHFGTDRMSHSAVVAGLNRFLPVPLPRHLGPDHDTVQDSPGLFHAYLKMEYLRHLDNIRSGRGFWRRRVEPLPAPVETPGPSRVPRQGRQNRGRSLGPTPVRGDWWVDGNRAQRRPVPPRSGQSVGEVLVGAWPERPTHRVPRRLSEQW